MSLIFGYWSYQLLETNDMLQKMYRAVSRFPHQKYKTEQFRQAGFGQMVTYNTPESAFEDMPVTIAEKELLFMAEGRIDNRATLASQLGIRLGSAYPDGKIMLESYLKWGKDCVNYLQGNWSFAAYNAKEQELFIARDQTGYNALFYYQDETGFYFSTSIKSLLALPCYVKKLNEEHFVRKLTGWDDDKFAVRSTFYAGIYSLPLAHSLTVKNKKISLNKYWDPAHIPLRRYKNTEQYSAEMLEIFSSGVQAKLRSSQPVASMLSGGLDSSSVSYIAADILKNQDKSLTTFSHVPFYNSEMMADPLNQSRVLDETPFIQKIAAASGNIHPVFLDSGNYSILKGMRTVLEISDRPSHGSGNSYWLMDIYSNTARRGFGTLFTGEGGNTNISFESIDYLLPFKFNRIIKHPYKFLRSQVAKPIALKYFNRYYNKRDHSLGNHETYISNIFIHRSIVDKYGIIEDIRDNKNEMTKYMTDVLEKKMQFIEVYDARSAIGAAVGNYFGIELRDPTMDINVVEYFYSIPNDVFFDDDYNTRMLVKRMMKGKLPDEVLFEKRKGLQSADLSFRAKAQAKEITAAIEQVLKSPAANEYIDTKKLYDTWQQYLKDDYILPYKLQWVLKALHFAMFLQVNFD